MTAYNAADLSTFAAMYGDNATIMSLRGPDLVGRASIDSAFAADSANPRNKGATGTWKSDTIEVHGDYAYEVGSGTFIRPATGAGTAPDTIRNRYITFWRKGPDGRWRVTRDFTVNVPRPTK